MTLHERISLWPRRKRAFAFFATVAVGWIVIARVLELAEPGMLSRIGFWQGVVNLATTVVLVVVLGRYVDRQGWLARARATR